MCMSTLFPGYTVILILPPETYHASGDIYLSRGCFQYLIHIHEALSQNMCKVLGSRRLLGKVCESLQKSTMIQTITEA